MLLLQAVAAANVRKLEQNSLRLCCLHSLTTSTHSARGTNCQQQLQVLGCKWQAIRFTRSQQTLGGQVVVHLSPAEFPCHTVFQKKNTKKKTPQQHTRTELFIDRLHKPFISRSLSWSLSNGKQRESSVYRNQTRMGQHA